ncbi:MAG: hypothetical protein ACQETI_10600 [Halobacteriota archaeon]
MVYPFSEARPLPATESFAHRDGDEYRVAASLTIDGDPFLVVEGVVTTAGERYVRQRQDGVVTERYQSHSDEDVVFDRTIVDGDYAERRLRQLKSDPDREIVRERWDGETLTVVAVTEGLHTDLADDLAGSVSVVTTQLRLAQYDPVEASDSAVRRLRPRSGWYAGSESYRLTDADGEVRANAETDALHSAAVRWDLTRGTETYLHYLLNSGTTVTQSVSYQYDPRPVAIEAPDWTAT